MAQKRKLTDYMDVLDFFAGTPPEDYHDAQIQFDHENVECSPELFEQALQAFEQP